jgi:hypothetical protein
VKFKKRTKAHKAIFCETTIHYVFTWSASEPLDVYRFASRLLESGIADTVGSPAGPEVRVSPQLARFAKHIRKIRRLKALRNVHRPSDLVKQFFHDPHLTAQLIWLIYKNRKSPPAPIGPTPAKSSIIDDAEQQIKGIIASAQAVNAIQHEIENDLYSSTYLSTEPYLRLTLKSVPCWLAIADEGIKRETGDMSGGVRAEVLLLVHKSGTIQLTFVMRLPNSLSADSLVPLTIVKSTFIKHCEIAEPVLRAASRRNRISESGWPGQWAEHAGGSCRWREIGHELAATIESLFGLYQDAIEETAKAPTLGGWQCHPVVFIDSLGCCNSETQWLSEHRKDLWQIVSRTEQLSFREPMTAIDRALTTDFSIYYNAGSTTRISWKFSSGISEFADQLQTVVLIEHVLLRYWQLVSLNERIMLAQGNSRSSLDAQTEAIYGLREYRRSALVYGTAIEAADELLSDLHEQELYQRILDSLGLLQQMTAAEQSKRASRTANILAGSAVIATAVLGLPAIKASIDIARSLPSSGLAGKLAYPLRLLARHEETGIWLSYLALFFLVVSVMMASVILRNRPRFRLRFRRGPGVLWPYGTIRIIRRGAPTKSQETQYSNGLSLDPPVN